MSKDVKFIHDIHGINELMKSEWMQEIINEQAEAAVGRGSQLGVELETRTHLGSFTAIANIYAADADSAKKCSENRLLEKALYGGGS